jgi:hypothetical protein
MNLLDRAKQFTEGATILAAWLGGGGETVPIQMAQKRADICLKCPLNKPLSVVNETIAKAIKAQLEIKSKLNLRVNGEKSLRSCEACGCVTKLKIWVPLQRIKPDPDELEKFHQDCWLRNETP